MDTDTDVLPPLTDDVRAALRDSILTHGLMSPLIYTADGRLADGRNRLAILEAEGITDYPTWTLPPGVSAADANLHLNVLRRQLDRDWQQREMIRLASQGRSERAIAKVVDLSPATVHRKLSGSASAEAVPAVVHGEDGRTQRRAPRTQGDMLKMLDRFEAGDSFEAIAADEGISRDWARDLITKARKIDRGAVKADKPLPRANGKPQRDEWHRKKRHLDPARIVRESVAALQGISMGLALITPEDVNDVARHDWARDMKDALTTIERFRKGLARP